MIREGRTISGTRGAVAASPVSAAQAGARILAAGGNAMDAAAAACMAGCAAEPQMADIGGYLLSAVVLDAATDQVWSLDANSIAPAAASEAMFSVLPPTNAGGLNETEYGCSVQNNANVYGPLSIGVPGCLAGIGRLWERWGRLPWRAIVDSSLSLVEAGHPYGRLADAIRSMEGVLRLFPATASHLMPEGRLPEPDDTWRRERLAATLTRIRNAGWRDFYEGDLARRLAAFLQSAGGILTLDDLRAFSPRLAPAYEVPYHGARVFGAELPNGGLTCLQVLRMLDILAPSPETGADHWHRYAEALKLAWRDRLRYFGDPGFTPIDVMLFLGAAYAAGRVETLRQFPRHVDTLHPDAPAPPSHGTLHVSVADAEGNLVAATFSQGALFGSCVTVPDMGVILGHGMCRFEPRPGHPNSVQPRKRPLNNTAPMIVRTPDRDVAVGLPGGRRILSVNARAVIQLVDFRADPLAVVQSPRVHLERSEPLEHTRDLDPAICEALTRMGHSLRPMEKIANELHCVAVDRPARLVAGASNVWVAGPETG